ncbi:MAG: hypothetical protein Fur005_06940 [Roseiflexaceae bacterium]
MDAVVVPYLLSLGIYGDTPIALISTPDQAIGAVTIDPTVLYQTGIPITRFIQRHTVRNVQ